MEVVEEEGEMMVTMVKGMTGWEREGRVMLGTAGRVAILAAPTRATVEAETERWTLTFLGTGWTALREAVGAGGRVEG